MPAADDAQDSRAREPACSCTTDCVIGARRRRDFFRCFLLSPMLATASAWLATFWGPSVRYRPNTTSSAHRSARRGNATGLIFRKQNSEERTHEEAYSQPRCTLAVIVTAAGCSSSVGQSARRAARPIRRPATAIPPVAPRAPTPAATAALFQPAQGIFPFPNDLYFSGTTDGTINIQPANGLIPNQVGLERARRLVDHRADPHPLRRRRSIPLRSAPRTSASTRSRSATLTRRSLASRAPLTYGTEFSANVATDAGVGPTILEITPAGAAAAVGGPGDADRARCRTAPAIWCC